MWLQACGFFETTLLRASPEYYHKCAYYGHFMNSLNWKYIYQLSSLMMSNFSSCEQHSTTHSMSRIIYCLLWSCMLWHSKHEYTAASGVLPSTQSSRAPYPLAIPAGEGVVCSEEDFIRTLSGVKLPSQSFQPYVVLSLLSSSLPWQQRNLYQISIQLVPFPSSATMKMYATTVSKAIQLAGVVLEAQSPLSIINFELYLMSHLDH